MATGRSQPSIVIDVQVLVTHADSAAIMEREMGNPLRLSRAPDVCYLFTRARRSAAAGPGGPLGVLWHRGAGGPDPPTRGQTSRYSHPTPSFRQGQAGRDTSTPATGLIRTTGPRMAPPATGETRMSSTTDHVHEGHDQTAPPSADEWGSDGMMYAPPETEASFEEIER
jgi:hypothetical protein